MTAQKNSYSINLASLDTMAQAKDFVKNNNIEENTLLVISNSGKIMIMHGIYPKREDALNKISELPNNIKRNKPFLQKIFRTQESYVKNNLKKEIQVEAEEKARIEAKKLEKEKAKLEKERLEKEKAEEEAKKLAEEKELKRLAELKKQEARIEKERIEKEKAELEAKKLAEEKELKRLAELKKREEAKLVREAEEKAKLEAEKLAKEKAEEAIQLAELKKQEESKIIEEKTLKNRYSNKPIKEIDFANGLKETPKRVEIPYAKRLENFKNKFYSSSDENYTLKLTTIDSNKVKWYIHRFGLDPNYVVILNNNTKSTIYYGIFNSINDARKKTETLHPLIYESKPPGKKIGNIR